MNPKTKKNPHEYLVLHIAKAKDEFVEEIERLRKELVEVKRTAGRPSK